MWNRGYNQISHDLIKWRNRLGAPNLLLQLLLVFNVPYKVLYREYLRKLLNFPEDKKWTLPNHCCILHWRSNEEQIKFDFSVPKMAKRTKTAFCSCLSGPKFPKYISSKTISGKHSRGERGIKPFHQYEIHALLLRQYTF